MDGQQYKQVNNGDIDFRELFSALWKQKVIITCFTLVATILAAILSIFIIPPVYTTKLNIIISMPEVYNTKYGEYKLPITTNEQYINLIVSNDVIINCLRDLKYDTQGISIEKLKRKISIEKFNSPANADIVQNSFEVSVSDVTPEKALKLSETLYSNYMKFMDVMTKERAIGFYYNKFNVDIKSQELLLKSNKELLKKNEELLVQTPETINQKAAMNQIQNQLANTSEFVVLENIINPNYTEIEKKIVESKQLINTIEDTIRMDKENLKELESEKNAVDKYYQTGKTAKLESYLDGVVETSVYLPSPPVKPTEKASPKDIQNIAIGFVVGGALGVLVGLIKQYWFKKINHI